MAPPGDALKLRGRSSTEVASFSSPTLFASYLHQHLSAAPELPEKFVLATSRSPHIDVRVALH